MNRLPKRRRMDGLHGINLFKTKTCVITVNYEETDGKRKPHYGENQHEWAYIQHHSNCTQLLLINYIFKIYFSTFSIYCKFTVKLI